MSKRGLDELSRRDVALVKSEAKKISQLIKVKRKKLGLTQESLAESLEISVEAVRGIEIGRQFASFPTLVRICRVLKLQIDLSDRK